MLVLECYYQNNGPSLSSSLVDGGIPHFNSTKSPSYFGFIKI